MSAVWRCGVLFEEARAQKVTIVFDKVRRMIVETLAALWWRIVNVETREHMKRQAKILTALWVASVSFGAYGCGPKEVEPPVQAGQAQKIEGVEISVASFELTRPIFVDSGKNVYRMRKDDEVAVLTLKIRNTSDSVKSYKPLHAATGSERVQLCTLPDATLEAPNYGRVFFKPVKADGATASYATNQIVSDVEIPPGGEITDAYLFEKPATDKELVALVPGKIVVASGVLKLATGELKKVDPPAPAAVGEPVTVDGVSIKVTKVTTEYPELAPRTKPAKELKYAYAYTSDPVMAVYVTISNTTDGAIAYNPAHEDDVGPVSLSTTTGELLKRAKISGTVMGKDQVQGQKTIEVGESVDDVFYFSVPSDSVALDFSLAGKIVNVFGLYEYRLNYEKTTPPRPDLEPYKNPDANAADDENSEDEETADEAEE